MTALAWVVLLTSVLALVAACRMVLISIDGVSSALADLREVKGIDAIGKDDDGQ